MLGKKILALSLGVSLLSLIGCEGAEEREEKYLSKAQAYYDETNYEKMQVELKNVLQINPKNVKARYLMALAAEKDQNWRKMFAHLSATIDAQPDHYDAQLKLGKLFLFSKDIEKAAEKTELVLSAQPNNPDALALKATIHLSKKELTESKALLTKVLEIEPGHYEASLLLLKILGEEKNTVGAKQILEDAFAVHPEKIKLSLVKINMLLLEDKKDEAEAMYLSLIQKFPKNEGLYYNLVKLYMDRKKTDQAETVLRDLVNQLPDEDKPKFILTGFITRQRGFEQAEAELNTLIKENPNKFGFKLAKLTLYKGQIEKEQQILEEIIKDDMLGSYGIDARNKLAILLNAKGDVSQAKELIEKSLELDARNVPALLFRAGLSLKDKDFDAALADARSILRNNPESEKALMIQAIAQLKNKNAPLAMETLEKVVLINPKNLIATKDLARIKAQSNDIEGAIEILVKSQDHFKNNQDISVMLIDLYGKRQEWGKAESIAKTLLDQAEDKDLPRYKLAQLYMGQKKFEAAISQFEEIRASKPAAPDVLAGLVNSYLATNKSKKAEKLLDDSLKSNSKNPAIITMRAELHRQKKQLTKAEKLFKQVIELEPKAQIGYTNLASIYLIQKQHDKVIAVFEQGVKEIPTGGSLLMQLATLYTAMGRTDEAVDSYEKILILAPKNLLATNNLASLLSESKDKEKLEKAYALAEGLKDSKYPALLDTYSWVSFKNGKIDDALMVLETLITKEGISPEMHYHLGMVYIEKGRTEDAKMALEKATIEGANYNDIDIAKTKLKELTGQ